MQTLRQQAEHRRFNRIRWQLLVFEGPPTGQEDAVRPTSEGWETDLCFLNFPQMKCRALNLMNIKKQPPVLDWQGGCLSLIDFIFIDNQHNKLSNCNSELLVFIISFVFCDQLEILIISWWISCQLLYFGNCFLAVFRSIELHAI